MTAMALVVHAQTGNYRPYDVSPDFHEVQNAKQFMRFVALSPQHRANLQKNLFVVSPRGDEQLYWVYGVNDYRNLPSLVTTDTVLHLYHVFFDGTLRKVEQDFLLPRLQKLSAGMLAASRNQVRSLRDPAMRAAAEKNVQFFTVAQRLTDTSEDTFPTMDLAFTPAQDEIDRISAAKGYMQSAIFPYKVDYSRFIVRGHYSKTPKLRRFFRAMTWYGLMPFALTDQLGNPMPEQIRMAILATDALRSSGELADYQAIYEPTSLYVGASNMYTPEEIRQAALNAFSSTTSLRPSGFATFVNEVRAIRTPRIQANITQRKGVPNSALQFRFMGLRYIPDSEIMQRLSGEARPFPSGLDVMGVLGSERAISILDGNPSRYNPNHWTGYAGERAKLGLEFAQVPTSTWASNLYWGWLDCLRPFLKPAPEGYPEFMRNKAWETKSLSTALASWTELRHDTILYGEQSGAEMGDGDEPPPPFVKGFVEPSPVYARLLALTQQSRNELRKRGLIDSIGIRKFIQFDDLLAFLANTSRKELAGERLTKAEYLRIRHIEGELGDLTEQMLMYGLNFNSLTEDDRNMALIADVHTGGDYALEEGVGKADDLIAIVPVEGKLYFARGCVFSYYEFKQPISDRLTDEAWKKMLGEGSQPHRPFWIAGFFVEKKAEEKR